MQPAEDAREWPIGLGRRRNTDNGDGWEREGEDIDHFHPLSEKHTYPLAINIIFYVMTH